MKNRSFYAQESDQLHENNSERKPEIKIRMHKFSSPGERETMLKKIQISSQFDMRYRGLLEFYSDDLIAYKCKKGTGKHANEFLRIFAKHLTDNLEDNCPSSWKGLQPSFWEEFIFAFYPHNMKISTKQRESEIFLIQLKRFVRWLDNRAGTSWYNLVEKYAEEAASKLTMCERLLNHLYLRSFPTIHQENWNLEEELFADEEDFNSCTKTINSVFQVNEVYDKIITVHDIDSGQDFQISGLPCKIIEAGILLDGVIGKKSDDFYWTWFVTEGVYPSRAKDYFVFID